MNDLPTVTQLTNMWSKWDQNQVLCPTKSYIMVVLQEHFLEESGLQTYKEANQAFGRFMNYLESFFNFHFSS